MTRLRQFLADIAAAFRRLFLSKPKRCPRPEGAPERKRTLIIAYNHDAAREYARDNGLAPSDWVYATEREHLIGWSSGRVGIVRLAGWRNRKTSEFMDTLRQLEWRLEQS